MYPGGDRDGLPWRGGPDRGQPRAVHGDSQPGDDDADCDYSGGLRGADTASAEAGFQRPFQAGERSERSCRPVSQGGKAGAGIG